MFLPFKSPRYLSCPLFMQSKKGLETLSKLESREVSAAREPLQLVLSLISRNAVMRPV